MVAGATHAKGFLSMEIVERSALIRAGFYYSGGFVERLRGEEA